MARIEGLKELQRKMQKMAKDAADSGEASVTVGFTQRYALYVHENLASKHPVGQAKFLEQPARTMAGELGEIAATVYKKTRDMRQALMFAGLRLQREAMLLTPVDTSALKASAFTCQTADVDNIASAAFAGSEAIRTAEKPTK